MKLPVYLLALFFCLSFYGQQQSIPELNKKLNKTAPLTPDKVDILNELANSYIYTHIDSIPFFADESISLSKEINYPKGLAGAYKTIAIYYYYQGTIDSSFYFLDESVRIFKELEDDKGLSRAYNNYGVVLYRFGKYTESIGKYELAMEANRRVSDSLGILRNYVNLANVHSDLGNYDIARVYQDDALDLASLLDNQEQRANIFNGKAIIDERIGNFEEAKKNLQIALDIYQGLGLSDRKFIILNNLANINRKQGKNIEAIRNFEEAFKIAEALNNKRHLGIIYNNLANCYLDLFQEEKAFELYQKAVDISEKIDPRLYAVALSNMGLIIKEEPGRKEEALSYFQGALDYFLEQGVLRDASNMHRHIGGIFYNAEDYKQAEFHYIQAKEFAIESENKYELPSIYIGLGQISYQYKEYADAIEYATKATEIAYEIENIQSLFGASTVLYSTYKMLGDYEQALYYLEQENNYAKEIFDEDKAKELGRIEVENEFRVAEEQLKLENFVQLQVKEDKITQQQFLLWFGTLGFLSIISILLLLYWLQKRETKFLNLVKEKNKSLEKLNSQKDKLFSIVSHDLRGPLNTLNVFFDMMLNKQINEEEFSEMLPEIKANLESTLNLTNNLMSWSNNLEARPKKKNVQISAIVKQTEKLFQTSIREKKINFQSTISEDLEANIDDHTFDLVIRNLIANAIKYSNLNGTIKVVASVELHQIKFCVEDSGIGMEPQQAKHLFSQNMDSVLGTKNEEGSGIGLLLCSSFVQANKGSIWVEHTQLNEGTKICFTLPIKA